MAITEDEKKQGRIAIGRTVGVKNLKSSNKLSIEQRKELASIGGKASALARKERQTMSTIYANWLASQHNVRIAGSSNMRTMRGEELVSAVMSKIIAKGDKTAVNMMIEIRKATEGSILHIPGLNADNDLITRPADDLRAELERELARRDAITARRAQDAEELPPDAAPQQLVKVEILPDTRRTPEPGKA